MLVAKRNYKYISHKMLISKPATCNDSKREEVKEKFTAKLVEIGSLAWVYQILVGED